MLLQSETSSQFLNQQKKLDIYRQPRKLRQGNVFSRTCLFTGWCVCSQDGVSVHRMVCLFTGWCVCTGARPTLTCSNVFTVKHGLSVSGRLALYWTAFLLHVDVWINFFFPTLIWEYLEISFWTTLFLFGCVSCFKRTHSWVSRNLV